MGSPDPETPPDPVDVLQLLGGRASRAQVLARTSRWRLDTAVASGHVIRSARGRYHLPSLPEPLQVADRLRGAVSHLSAAQLHGLPLLNPPEAIHVTVSPGAHRAQSRAVVLHRGELTSQERAAGRTGLVRTVLDCAAGPDFVEAVAVVDSALRNDPDLADRLSFDAGRTWGPGRRRRLRVLAHATPLAANPFESGLRATLIEAGLTGFRPQVEIDTPQGRYRVDLADEERRLVLEADSFTWHGTRQALVRDARRYDELVVAGWTVLRFTWDDVMFDRSWVIRTVRAALAGAGRRAQNRTVAKVPDRVNPTRW